MKTNLEVLIVLLVLTACQGTQNHINKETVLNNISHVEDSIHYEIDSLARLCDILGLKSQRVDIGDCKLYCETEGKGIPLVLINGGPGGTHHYFHPWFSEASKYCKVIYYDQRGCGRSDFESGKNGYSFEQAVEDLDRLRQKLGIKKWVVVGYSYGGAIAQFYTATYPENTIGTVYIGAKPLIKDDALNGTQQYDYTSEEERQKIKECYKLYRKNEITFFQLLYNKGLNGDWKRQHYYKPTNEELIRASLYEWINDKGFNSTMSASVGRYNLEGIFEKCPIPTLLCEGKWDLTWKAEKKELMQKYLPNADYVLFEQSGHNIFSEEPELFFSVLENFVCDLTKVPEDTLHIWKEESSRIISEQQNMFKREIEFFTLIKAEGIKKSIGYYKTLKADNPNVKVFSESGMNRFGYSYYKRNDYTTAIQLFKMNISEYPESWNVYDSLGEAYLANGNKVEAVKNYEKSLALNPNNEAGKKVLKEITTLNKLE
ncbi:alpha/beta fold hydrolase [Saccharicrinis aurantiacus]|uniref:alpha/beta fold hydrolase n=1 Tax=Saccharicrinis aurantiacus TaxID=1849719 RepID=UPI00094FCB6C|nr:alpha/beta fold hydrolase [Saccharicrinis aurantiacus]